MSDRLRAADDLGLGASGVLRGVQAQRRGLVERLNRVVAGEPVLPELARDLVAVTGFDVVVIERYDRQARRLHVVAHAGLPPSLAASLDVFESADRTLFGLQLGEAAFFHRALDHPRLAHDLLRTLHIETLFAAPVRAGHDVLGSLSVAACRGLRASDTPRESLQALADHLGAAWTASLLVDLSQQHDRLEASARDAWVLAHEIRNPLHTLALQAASLRQTLDALPAPLRPPLDQGLAALESETRRLCDLLQHSLRQAQRHGAPRTTPTDLADLVRSVARFYDPAFARTGVRLSLDLPAELPVLDLDPAQIAQVLHNLLRNALDALPDGGRLALTLHVLPHQVELLVADSGPGLPDPDHAFRFFTTTRPHGTGLGLPVSREIARAHGGDLDLLPSREGTTLRLTLPRET